MLSRIVSRPDCESPDSDKDANAVPQLPGLSESEVTPLRAKSVEKRDLPASGATPKGLDAVQCRTVD